MAWHALDADEVGLLFHQWPYELQCRIAGIVHELLHFFVPNHGKLWKSLMRLHLGDYETYEAELKMASKFCQ